MSNIHLRDKNLSYKAKGLLSFMLSLPDDWEIYVDELIKQFDEKIQNLTQEVKKNKVFATTESWNGWGYDI